MPTEVQVRPGAERGPDALAEICGRSPTWKTARTARWLPRSAPRPPASPYPNCTDRFASPIQKPSITDFWAVGSPPASAAPMATKSGAKCSVRGWA